MMQEYLFMDNTHRTAVEEYVPAKVKVEISTIENSECWIATYSLPGENEESAKTLSEINDHIVSTFQPTVLTNESSAYFNKKLFPFINEFERKLRKLLYLKSALYNGEKRIDNIRDLEAKDLGDIFSLLFTDTDFVKNVKAKVNEKTWQFTKKEIIATITAIDEDTVWDHLLGKESVKTLSEDFLSVKTFRNDVMHAHNIGTQTYREAKRLFMSINEQLDAEIGTIIRIVEEQPEETAESEFNAALNSALQTHNTTALLRDYYDHLTKIASEHPNGMKEFLRQFQFYSSSEETLKMKEQLREFLSFQISPEYRKFQQDLQDLRNSAAHFEHMKQLSEELRKYRRDFSENAAPDISVNEEDLDVEEGCEDA